MLLHPCFNSLYCIVESCFQLCSSKVCLCRVEETLPPYDNICQHARTSVPRAGADAAFSWVRTWQRRSAYQSPPCLSSSIFSFLDVVTLCRCAQVSRVSVIVEACVAAKKNDSKCLFCPQSWNVLALDGSNWQRIDLFDFQRDIEVSKC